jgi:hypothetical protein
MKGPERQHTTSTTNTYRGNWCSFPTSTSIASSCSPCTHQLTEQLVSLLLFHLHVVDNHEENNNTSLEARYLQLLKPNQRHIDWHACSELRKLCTALKSALGSATPLPHLLAACARLDVAHNLGNALQYQVVHVCKHRLNRLRVAVVIVSH